MKPKTMKQESTLASTSAREARHEAHRRWPDKDVHITGYHDGQCVYLTTIRARGNKHPVATAILNRSPRATTFTATYEL